MPATRRRPGQIVAAVVALVTALPSVGGAASEIFREIEAEGGLALGRQTLISQFKELIDTVPDNWPSAAAAAAGIDFQTLASGRPSTSLGAEGEDRQPSMLEAWLRSLVLHIPPIDEETSSYEVHVHGGTCGGLSLSGINTAKKGNKLKVGAYGISAGCTLGLKFIKYIPVLPDISLEVDVAFNVTDSKMSGSLELVTDGGNPPFPKAVLAPKADCAGPIKVSNLKLSGSLIVDLVGLISGIIRRILSSRLASIICEQIDNAAQTIGEEALHNATVLGRKYLASQSHSPAAPSDLHDPNGDFVDFRKNPAPPFLSRLLSKVLNNASSPHSLNAIIAHYLGPDGNFSSGESRFFPIKTVVPVASLGQIGITIHSIAVGDLTKWSKLAFNVDDAHSLSGGFEMGELFADVTLTLDVAPNCDPGKCPLSGQNLTESFDFSATLHDVGSKTSTFLVLNSTHMHTLAVDQLASISCLAPGLTSPLLTGAGFNLGLVQTSLKPAGAMFGDSLEADVDRMLNFMIDDTLGIFAPTLSALGNTALAVTLRDAANDKVTSALASALGQKCPPPAPDYTSPFLAKGGLVMSIVFFCAGLLSLPLGCFIKKRLEKDKARRLELERRMSPTGDENVSAGASMSTVDPSQSQLGDPFVSVDPDDNSLAFHPRLDLGTRICIPLLVISTLLLFLSSNSGIGAAVRLSITVGGEDVVVLPPVSGFSLISSVKDMWHGGVYPLAILIGLFSGVWPYAKLIMMLACWFCPRKRMKLEHRQRFLEFLDAYGKWSMVDTFVMVIFMVAFRFDLSGMGAINPMIAAIFKELGEDATFTVYIEPTLGFHTFLIATIMSLCLSHGMTACHRRALKQGEFGIAEIYDTPEVLSGGRRRLCNILRPANYWEGKIFVYGPFTAVAVSLVMVLVGMFLETMSFKFLGLSGFVLGEEKATRPYSIVSLGLKLPYSSMAPNSIGVRWIQVCYCLFAALIMPAYLAILLCLWAAPLSNAKQRQYLVAAQILNAWSGLDVFCTSIIASVLEIRQFALFMVGDKCDLINKIIAQLPMAKEFDGPPTCFDVESELKPGLYILTAAAIIALITGQITLVRCSDALLSVRPRLLSSIRSEGSEAA